MSKQKPEHRDQARDCQYNKGVSCQTPVKERRCGKCGWRPKTAQQRLQAIKKKREGQNQ